VIAGALGSVGTSRFLSENLVDFRTLLEHWTLEGEAFSDCPYCRK
jgi:hypothetical protein